MIARKQDSTARLYADFSPSLNGTFEDNHNPLPVAKDVFVTLNSGTYFAKSNLSETYLLDEVEPECCEYLTVNSHRSLYQFTRLPFGVKIATCIYQHIIDNKTSRLKSTAPYLNDIIVVGRTANKFKELLKYPLECIADYCFPLRPEKHGFFLKSKISWLHF